MPASRAHSVLEHSPLRAIGAGDELGNAFIAIGHASETSHGDLHASVRPHASLPMKEQPAPRT